jgi:hypothetical protein
MLITGVFGDKQERMDCFKGFFRGSWILWAGIDISVEESRANQQVSRLG